MERFFDISPSISHKLQLYDSKRKIAVKPKGEMSKKNSVFFCYLKSSLPYDWRKPFGFVITTLLITLLVGSLVTLFIAFILIYIGVTEFLATLSLDIQCYLKEIDDEYINEPADLTKTINLKIKLNETIKFHSKSLR